MNHWNYFTEVLHEG